MKTSHKIGWRVSEFWQSTLVEFFDCIEAQNEMGDEGNDTGAPSGSEINRLIAEYGG